MPQSIYNKSYIWIGCVTIFPLSYKKSISRHHHHQVAHHKPHHIQSFKKKKNKGKLYWHIHSSYHPISRDSLFFYVKNIGFLYIVIDYSIYRLNIIKHTYRYILQRQIGDMCFPINLSPYNRDGIFFSLFFFENSYKQAPKWKMAIYTNIYVYIQPHTKYRTEIKKWKLNRKVI